MSGPDLRRARRPALRRRGAVPAVHAGPDEARHRDLHRQDRAVRVHLVGLGLREAGAALPHDRKTPQSNPYWDTAATRSPARRCCASRALCPIPSCARATRCGPGMPIEVGDAGRRHPPHDRRQAGDRHGRRLVAVDADASGGRGAGLRAPPRQRAGDRRGFPHHHRPRLHLEPDPRGDRARLRRRGDPCPRADRRARRATTRNGKGR